MSPSFLTSSTVKAQRFRDFLADHDLVDVDLRQMAENSFKESGTSVSTVMLKLKKLSD
jgi:hypothetical protein